MIMFILQIYDDCDGPDNILCLLKSVHISSGTLYYTIKEKNKYHHQWEKTKKVSLNINNTKCLIHFTDIAVWPRTTAALKSLTANENTSSTSACNRLTAQGTAMCLLYGSDGI